MWGGGTVREKKNEKRGLETGLKRRCKNVADHGDGKRRRHEKHNNQKNHLHCRGSGMACPGCIRRGTSVGPPALGLRKS